MGNQAAPSGAAFSSVQAISCSQNSREIMEANSSSAKTVQWINDLRDAGDHAVRLANELPYFAENLLKIRPKAGSLGPFVFNEAQENRNTVARVLTRQIRDSIHGSGAGFNRRLDYARVASLDLPVRDCSSPVPRGMLLRFWVRTCIG
jgi:hypothetical protein